MSVTYTATDSTGLVHTRKSKGHSAQRYFYAVVLIPGCKRKPSFASTHYNAAKVLNDHIRYGYDKAEIVEVTAVVK